jgi:hypothetical protein
MNKHPRSKTSEGFFPVKERAEPRHTARCKFCGQRRLRWKQTKRGWRLVDRKGWLHVCQEYVDHEGGEERRSGF